MSQKDFLENQVIEEILRERANYYTSKDKIKDFWVTNSPNFINLKEIKSKIKKTNFYKQKIKSISSDLNDSNYEFYTALITSNVEFIKWVQLRLGYFEDILTIENLNNSYISDGIFGIINNTTLNDISILDFSPKYLHPDILLNRYKKSIEIYYKLEN